jgi:hypothetical protein
MRRTTNATAHKIVLSFDSPQKALDWFGEAARAGLVPEGSDLYTADALDASRGVDPRTYLIRRIGDRPEHSALRNVLARKARKRRPASAR